MANVLFCALATELALVLLVSTTYLLWIAQGNPWFLPSISDTWEAPPGAYLSRSVGFLIALSLFLIVNGLFYILQDLSKDRKSNTLIPHIVYWSGVVGAFCISWVMAICDNPDAVCRGDDDIHSVFAVSFFVLFDLAILLSFVFFYETKSFAHTFILTLIFIIKAILKLRYIALFNQLFPENYLAVAIQSNPEIHVYGDTLTGIAEVTDLAITCITMDVFLKKYYPGYFISVGQLKVIKNLKHTKVKYSFNTVFCMQLAVVIFGAGLVFTVFANMYRGTINIDEGVLPVAFLEQYKPSNWVGHWTFMLAATVFAFGHWQIMKRNHAKRHAGNTWKTASVILGLVAVLAFSALAVVGIVNVDQNAEVNKIAVDMYFILYGVYMFFTLYYIFYGNNSNHTKYIAMSLCVLCALGSSAAKSRYFSFGTDTLSYNLWEWIDFDLSMFFILFYVDLISDDLSEYRLIIYYTRPSTREMLI